MPQVHALADLVFTFDIGALSSWKFHDMKPQVSSAAIDNIKFEKGLAKQPLTREEAEELSAGIFTMR